jgi:RHS repeat-associated protein
MRASNSSVLNRYCYDALGRRIEKVIDASGTNPQVTRFLYQGWQVIEERDGASAVQESYVWGRSVDEPLTMRRGTTNSYYEADDMGNVMALSNSSGAVVERYEYDDYGRPLDPTTLAPLAGSPSTRGNPHLFQGHRYDPEIAFYEYRTRYLDPRAGRFVTRDTIGIWGDEANLGNASTFVGNNGWSRVDPYGVDDMLVSQERSVGHVGRVVINERDASRSNAVDKFKAVAKLNKVSIKDIDRLMDGVYDTPHDPPKRRPGSEHTNCANWADRYVEKVFPKGLEVVRATKDELPKVIPGNPGKSAPIKAGDIKGSGRVHPLPAGIASVHLDYYRLNNFWGSEHAVVRIVFTNGAIRYIDDGYAYDYAGFGMIYTQLEFDRLSSKWTRFETTRVAP